MEESINNCYCKNRSRAFTIHDCSVSKTAFCCSDHAHSTLPVSIHKLQLISLDETDPSCRRHSAASVRLCVIKTDMRQQRDYTDGSKRLITTDKELL